MMYGCVGMCDVCVQVCVCVWCGVCAGGCVVGMCVCVAGVYVVCVWVCVVYVCVAGVYVVCVWVCVMWVYGYVSCLFSFPPVTTSRVRLLCSAFNII